MAGDVSRPFVVGFRGGQYGCQGPLLYQSPPLQVQIAALYLIFSKYSQKISNKKTSFCSSNLSFQLFFPCLFIWANFSLLWEQT